MSSLLIPAKKLYEWLYSRTWPRQKRQYSFSRVRPLGARWVAAPLQPGHSQHGCSARSRRSWSGLTRIRSNRGESLDMTGHYADAVRPPSSLDKIDIAPSGTRVSGIDPRRLTRANVSSAHAAKRHGHEHPRSHHEEADQGFGAGATRRRR